MFEFRLSTLIKALVALAVILFGFDHLHKLDQLKAQLAELKTQAAMAHETMELRRQEWTELKAAKDKLDQAKNHEDELIAKRDLLDTQQRRLASEVTYFSDAIAAAVEKARTAAIGTVIPELKLEGRATLYQARIFKINNDSITFLHSDGVANLNVKAAELPADYVRKFDLGPLSLSQGLEDLRVQLHLLPSRQ